MGTCFHIRPDALKSSRVLDSRPISAYTACMPKPAARKLAPARSTGRSIVLGLGISLDGYIARPDGAVDFLFMPKDYSMAPFFKTIDAAILGRKTYDVAQKMGGGFSSFKIEYYIMSRTLPAGERDGLVFTSESPKQIVSRLRKRKGKNIWLMGGGEVARAFLIDDLVDELHLGVVPVLLGSGLPLFPPGFPQRNFTLAENKTFSRGLISLKYQRTRSVKK